MKTYLIVGVAAFLLGGAAVVVLRPGPSGRLDPPPVEPEVVIEERPEPVVQWRERIEYRDRPVVRETVVDTVVVAQVDSFVSAVRDSTVEPRFLEYSFDYGVESDERLRMWGVRSDGALVLSEHDVRKPFKGGWAGDSTFAREHRLSRFPKWKVAGGIVAIAACVLYCDDLIREIR